MAEPTGGTAEPYAEATFESLYADEVDAMARLAFLMVGSAAQTDSPEEIWSGIRIILPPMRGAGGRR